MGAAVGRLCEVRLVYSVLCVTIGRVLTVRLVDKVSYARMHIVVLRYKFTLVFKYRMTSWRASKSIRVLCASCVYS